MQTLVKMLFLFYLLISLPLYVVSEVCKNVKSDIRYGNACLHEEEKEESLECETIKEIVQMFCTSRLSIGRVKFNIKEFCNDNIKHVFNKFMEQKRKLRASIFCERRQNVQFSV